MISVSTAVTLFLTGGGFALVCVIVGVVIHNRWIDGRLAPKKPATVHVKQVP